MIDNDYPVLSGDEHEIANLVEEYKRLIREMEAKGLKPIRYCVHVSSERDTNSYDYQPEYRPIAGSGAGL